MGRSIVFYEKSKIFAFTFDQKNLEALNTSFKAAIYEHPFRYLYHRFLVLGKTFVSSKHRLYGFISHDDAKTYSIHFFKKNRLKKLFAKYNNMFPSLLTANGISFLMMLFYLAIFIHNRKDTGSKELILLRNISIIGLAYTFILLFTTMSSDYRYYYIVRVLSFMAIPIYLNLRAKAEKQE